MNTRHERQGRDAKISLKELRGPVLGEIHEIDDLFELYSLPERVPSPRDRGVSAQKFERLVKISSIVSEETPQLREKSVRQALKTIPSLVKDQRHEAASIAEAEESFAIIRNYFNSGNFRRLALRREALLKRGENFDEVNRNFAGKVFESLAFKVFSFHLRVADPSLVLLSPDRSHSLTRSLIPEPKVQREYFGNSTIVNSGTYNPDGYILKTTQARHDVVGMVEYSTTRNGEKFEKQYVAFKGMKERIPEVIRDSRFVMVLPQKTVLQNFDPISYPDIDVIEVNVTRGMLNQSIKRAI